MSDVAIHIENLGKRYRMGKRQVAYKTLRDSLANAFTQPFRWGAGSSRSNRTSGGDDGETMWALRGVSCEINQGDVVGIIGLNGAGKSTLLKILSRITEPSVGSVDIYGRVGSLLEVGTGFHPELTGRENVYLNGAILGMKKWETDSQFDAIVAFSGVEGFIDTQVKHYSSGMYLRLAFAVAAHLEPEILLVDEVLAVGDMTFQQKCLGKMEDVARDGRTVLFVSHNLAAVEHLCRKGIVLKAGQIAFIGTAREAVQYYLEQDARESLSEFSNVVDLAMKPRKSREHPLLLKLELFTGEGQPVTGMLRIGAPLIARVYFTLEVATESFDVGLGFDNLLGTRIFTAHSVFQPKLRNGKRVGDQIMVCEIPSLTLVPGQYKIRVALNIGDSIADVVDDAVRITIIDSDYYGTGRVPWNGTFVLPHCWYYGDKMPLQPSETLPPQDRRTLVS